MLAAVTSGPFYEGFEDVLASEHRQDQSKCTYHIPNTSSRCVRALVANENVAGRRVARGVTVRASTDDNGPLPGAQVCIRADASSSDGEESGKDDFAGEHFGKANAK